MRGLEVVVLIGAAVILLSAVAGRLRTAPPLLLLAGGVALGFNPAGDEVGLPPEVVLFLFLPALLYWESLTTSLREIRANLRPIVLLSVGLVLATAAAVAVAGHAFGLSWPMAWVLGAALAPTDPTAVAAVAGRLPRRVLTTLRVESLINDGTALVIYAVAVEAATGEHPFSVGSTAWRFVASYAGGLAVGVAVALLVVRARRLLPNPLLANALSVLTPFLAYLPAEQLEVSGVVAVVVCGLTLSRFGPRIVTATTRRQAAAFWQLTTFLLNGALFVLVGLQLRQVVDGLTGYSLGAAVGVGLAIAAVVTGTRLAWLYSTPYVIRALDRRPAQRRRRVGARQRLPIAWAGFRGAVSLAVSLAVPATGPDGAPLAGRDLVLLVTFVVIAAILLAQGLTMPAVVRFARLPADPSEAEEQRLAEATAARAGLAALDHRGTAMGIPGHVTAHVRADYEEHLRTVDGHIGPDVASTNSDADAERRLRAALIADKRQALIELRDHGRVDDIVLRRVQAQLDAEEIRLTGVPTDDD